MDEAHGAADRWRRGPAPRGPSGRSGRRTAPWRRRPPGRPRRTSSAGVGGVEWPAASRTRRACPPRGRPGPAGRGGGSGCRCGRRRRRGRSPAPRVGEAPLGAEPRHGLLGGVGRRGRHADQAGAGPPQGAGVDLADEPGADDADAVRVRSGATRRGSPHGRHQRHHFCRLSSRSSVGQHAEPRRPSVFDSAEGSAGSLAAVTAGVERARSAAGPRAARPARSSTWCGTATPSPAATSPPPTGLARSTIAQRVDVLLANRLAGARRRQRVDRRPAADHARLQRRGRRRAGRPTSAPPTPASRSPTSRGHVLAEQAPGDRRRRRTRPAAHLARGDASRSCWARPAATSARSAASASACPARSSTPPAGP